MNPVDAPEIFAFPLSFSQERMWFLERLEPGTAMHNVPAAFRLTGPLDVGVLDRTIHEIVCRHEALRTTIVVCGDEPVQAVAAGLLPDFSFTDLSHLPTDERATAAQELADGAAGRPFDLQNGPLIRVAVLRLQQDDHVLVVVMHHLVSEGGWSMRLLLQEIEQIYPAFLAGQPSPLSDLSIQFADCVLWQRERLRDESLDELLGYWRKQFENLPAPLDLPTDRVRPFRQTYRGARERLWLTPELEAGLRSLAKSEGATLFIILLAAFNTLLLRYTGQDDIIVGSPVAARPRPEMETVIGPFANMLALRTDVSGDPSFRRLLARVRQFALEAYAHQDLPFEKLIEALQFERNLQTNPLVQVMFALQNTSQNGLSLPGLEGTALGVETGSSQFDLSFHIYERPGGLEAVVEYATDLFDDGTARRLLRHYNRLLESCVQTPDRSLSELDMLTSAEIQQLTVDWNQTFLLDPDEACLHQLFERQVERTPNASAVICGAKTLTFRQLNKWANRLAAKLCSLGCRPGTLVGLCLERSSDMVVALLAVLKTGAAYVPLDPSFPASRLEWIVGDAEIAVLVTHSRHSGIITTGRCTIVNVDSIDTALTTASEANLSVDVSLTDIAYVIYTSGSTGRPKGVMVPHRGVCNFVRWMLATFPLTETDRVLQRSSFIWDASVWEFYVPLTSGACLVLAPPDPMTAAAEIGTLIKTHRITCVQLVPSLLQVLLADKVLATCPSLKWVFCGGEALPSNLVGLFFRQSTASLFNLYGPTETSIYSTYWECRPGFDRPSVPIGRPIFNTQVYILDLHRKPIPVGVVGTLHIGGAGVARGYLNSPELTGDRFVCNPFSERAEERIYDTGDLARFLPDGTVEFLGRRDQQVKLRGIRIELGEIEAALVDHPGISSAAAVLDRSATGEHRIIAYAAGGNIAEKELQASLKERLPYFMIPSLIIPIARLPVLPNGKLDRSSLPSPPQPCPAQQVSARPKSSVEKELAAIWEQILGVGPITTADNFFALGGHSLLAVRLFAQIKIRMGVDLPLATLFREPTIEGLARLIAESSTFTDTTWSSLVEITKANGVTPPLFCVHGAGGNVLNFSDLADDLGSGQPVYALQACGVHGTLPALDSIGQMAQMYIAEIQYVQANGPYFLLGYSGGGTVAFEMAQQLKRRGEEVALLALIDTSSPTVYRRRVAAGERLVQGWQRGEVLKALSWYMPGKVLERQWNKFRSSLALLLGGRADGPPVTLREAYLVEKFRIAYRHYQPQPYQGKIVLFRTRPTEPGLEQEEELGWRALAEGGVELLYVSGDHASIMYRPHVQLITARLRRSTEPMSDPSTALVRESVG